MTSHQTHLDRDSHWATLGPEVPADLSRQRVLDIGAAGGLDDSATSLRARGAREVVGWESPEAPSHEANDPFDLIYCRDSIQRTAHPMNFLSRLWHLSAENAILLLQSRVLPDPESSMYARFVPVALTGDPHSDWLPGRLALRWSVETSGFDIERWLPADASAPGDPAEPSVYLRAIRSDRQPAIDLATPTGPVSR
jgi:hypothetical protein